MQVPAEAFSSLSIEIMTRERMRVEATVSLLRIAIFLLQYLVLGAVTNGLSNGCGWCLSATGLLCNLFQLPIVRCNFKRAGAIRFWEVFKPHWVVLDPLWATLPASDQLATARRPPKQNHCINLHPPVA